MAHLNLKNYWTCSDSLSEETPIVFLHGFTGLASDWECLWQNLPTVKKLALDLPGHGTNPQNDCHFEAMAAQFWQDLDDMHIHKIHLVGYSMGGRLALYLAVMFPKRIQSVVIISGSPGLQDPAERESRRQADELLAMRLEAEGLAVFLQQWYQQELFAGLRQWQGFEVLMQSKLNSHQATRLAQSLRHAGTGVAPSMWSHLSELHVPALFISGKSDTKFCQLGQQMQSLCPNSDYKTAPGGHAPHLESARELGSLLKLIWISFTTEEMNHL